MNDLTLNIYGVPVTLPEAEWDRIVSLTLSCSTHTLRVSDVFALRKLYHERKHTTVELARRYGISQRSVFRALTGESYSYVPHPASARGYAALRDPELCQFVEEA